LLHYAHSTGKLVGQLDVAGTELAFRADVDFKFNAAVSCAMSPREFRSTMSSLRSFRRPSVAPFVGDLKRVVVAAGPCIGMVEGHYRATRLPSGRCPSTRARLYRLSLSAAPQVNGRRMGPLRDLGGPFAVEGHGAGLTRTEYLPRPGLSSQAVRPQAERVVREITLGAPA
jgi:hypothetical protein